MVRLHGLITNNSKFLLFLASDIIPFLVNLVIFSLLLRKTSADVYGKYVFLISIITWINTLILFGMNYTGVSLIRGNLQSILNVIEQIIKLRFILYLVCCLILALLAIGHIVTIAMSFSLAFLSLAQVFQVDFVTIALEKPNFNSIARLTQGITMFLITFFIINKNSNAEIIIFYQAISVFFGLIALYLLLKPTLSYNNRVQKIKIGDIFKNGVSISISQFCQAGYLNMDVIVLGLFSRDAVFIGQYGAFSKLLLTGLTPMASLLNSFSATLSSAFLSKDKDKITKTIKRMQKMSNFLGIVGFFTMLILSKLVIELFSGNKTNVSLLSIFLFSAIYLLYALQLPFYATMPYFQKNKGFLVISASTLIISIIFSTIGVLIFSNMFVILGTLAYSSFLAYSSKRFYYLSLRIFK